MYFEENAAGSKLLHVSKSARAILIRIRHRDGKAHQNKMQNRDSKIGSGAC